MKTLINSILFVNIVLFTEENLFITSMCIILLILFNGEVLKDDKL